MAIARTAKRSGTKLSAAARRARDEREKDVVLLVSGASVERLQFSAKATPHYNVTISFPNGLRKKASTHHRRWWRKMCKKMGLRTTTKVGKAASDVLLSLVNDAVGELEKDPVARARMTKARAVESERRRKIEEERERVRREQLRREVVERLVSLNASKAEAMELWKESLARSVMES